jgi:hypothetical protein
MAAKNSPRKKRSLLPAKAVPSEGRCGYYALFASSATQFPTERELKALDMMRRIREESSGVRRQVFVLKGIGEDGYNSLGEDSLDRLEIVEQYWEQDMAEELLSCCARVYELWKEWDEWDEQRMTAAEERMRELGHIQ